MKKSFTEKIKKDSPLIGTLITLASPEVAEIFSLSGFDWLFIDMEHGTLSTSDVQRNIQAIKNDCLAIVRVPENSSVWIKKALDTGCDGIIIPQVNTVEDAKKAVNAAKYPPLGARSVGITRAHTYGISFQEYVKTANEKVALIIQIEHIDGVNNLQDILKVKGIDGVLIGPYDLSGSINVLGEVLNKPVQEAISKIKKLCKVKDIPFGIFVMNAELAKKEINDGCSFIAVGIDTVLLANGAKKIVTTIRK